MPPVYDLPLATYDELITQGFQENPRGGANIVDGRVIPSYMSLRTKFNYDGTGLPLSIIAIQQRDRDKFKVTAISDDFLRWKEIERSMTLSEAMSRIRVPIRPFGIEPSDVQ